LLSLTTNNYLASDVIIYIPYIYIYDGCLQSSENRSRYHIIDGIEDKLQNFFENRRNMISRWTIKNIILFMSGELL